jgi:hypothetical protein
MTKREALEIWAPSESTWSRWVKTVLFAFMQPELMNEGRPFTGDWDLPLDPQTAVFVDLPGAESVEAGLALASNGYRPIPLHNACPSASVDSDPGMIALLTGPKTSQASAAVDVVPIITLLCEGVKKLRHLSLLASAPPAFLVDANRRGPGYFPLGGTFDNRSVVSRLDVPSGFIMQEQGIHRVILLQSQMPQSGRKIQPDLLEILLAWQQLGIQILFQRPWAVWDPIPVELQRPPVLVRLYHKLSSMFGTRRNEFGSFGAVVGHGG